MEHDGEQVVRQTAREDVKKIPIENPHLVLFTDGSSFMEQGVRGDQRDYH
jgi:hypothetical protein